MLSRVTGSVIRKHKEKTPEKVWGKLITCYDKVKTTKLEKTEGKHTGKSLGQNEVY